MNYIPNIFITLLSYSSSDLDFINTLMILSATGISVLLCAIILWCYADKIALAIIKDIPEKNEKINVEYDKIALIAFTVAGIFVLTKAVPDLIRMTFQLNWQLTNQLNFKETKSYIEALSRIIGIVVQVGMGVWLAIGSKGLVKALSAFRNFGTDRIEVKEE